MARSARPPDLPGLFDLPLTDEPESDLGEVDFRTGPFRAPESPRRETVRTPRPAAPEPAPPPGSDPTAPPPTAGFVARTKAGLIDLFLLVLVMAVAWFGAFLLGSRPTQESWPPFAAFLVVFSFGYAVMPLAFWGATPGMLIAGLVSRALDGHSISFGQAVRRWLAGWLLLALAGLPALFAFSRASFADRLSGSRTYRS